MPEEKKKYRVFISAAEASADSHCADLIKALKKIDPEIEFIGVGGVKMKAAGCKLIEETASKAVMAEKAFAHIGRFFLLIRKISKLLQKEKFDLVIVCDSPAFNFHVAKAAVLAESKTLFYVAPQLWAWAPWRIKKLHNFCDKLCCILPFEEKWFKDRGVDATYVGNPLMDEFGSKKLKARNFKKFDPTNVKIALMPGSRKSEISRLWEPMQQIANRIRRKYPGAEVTAVAVDDEIKEMLRAYQVLGFRCQFTIGDIYQTAMDSDIAIVASGSATLQVAAAGCPMVVMYQANKYLWHAVARWMMTIKHLSLVNILAGKELVPEFMPYFTSIEPIAEAANTMLGDNKKLTKLSEALIKLVEPLALGNTAETVAKTAIDLLSGDGDECPDA
jgi:lipid-A-disaccharide synthase